MRDRDARSSVNVLVSTSIYTLMNVTLNFRFDYSVYGFALNIERERLRGKNVLNKSCFGFSKKCLLNSVSRWHTFYEQNFSRVTLWPPLQRSNMQIIQAIFKADARERKIRKKASERERKNGIYSLSTLNAFPNICGALAVCRFRSDDAAFKLASTCAPFTRANHLSCFFSCNLFKTASTHSKPASIVLDWVHLAIETCWHGRGSHQLDQQTRRNGQNLLLPFSRLNVNWRFAASFFIVFIT